MTHASTEAAPSARPRPIPIVVLGNSLGLFFVVSYLLCILFYFAMPDVAANHAVLTIFLPGFRLLTLGSFLLGLVESFALGWYVAVVFGPIYNVLLARRGG